MTKATSTLRHASSRPTCLQLLASWQSIWSAKLKGDPGNRRLLDAINYHVALFPAAQQPDVLARVRKITGQYSDPVQIRALLQRGNRAINHHITPAED